MDNFTMAILIYHDKKKMTCINHIAQDLQYDDVIAKAASEFNLFSVPVTLYDCTSDCEIPESMFQSYCLTMSKLGLIQFKVNTDEVSFEFTDLSIGSDNLLSQNKSEPYATVPNFGSEKEIEDLLVQSYPTVIRKIKSANGKLTSKERNDISKIIIKQIVNKYPNQPILKEQFLKLTKSIKVLFPNELEETYYIPASGGIIAKGKLFNSYNNYRAELGRIGFIQRRSRSSSNTSSTVSGGTEITDLDAIIDTDIEEDIEYLGCHTDDIVLIESKWRATHSYRINLLKSNLSTYDYFEKFPSLKTPAISKLLLIDTKLKYPSLESSENWVNICHIIVEKEKLKKHDTFVMNLIKRIETADENEKLALSLVLIPYILPNNGKRRSNGRYRASKSEIQNSFISLYKTAVEFNESKGPQEFPKLVFIGEPLDLIYVCILGEKCIFKSALEALSLCFNIYMGINVKYPPLSNHIWTFVQRAIFKVRLENDEIIPSVITLTTISF